VKPSLGTGRQLLRSITVGGSTPTPGRIAIEHATSALGDVLAYFFPDSPNVVGYSPSLRQYRVSAGTVTADSTLVSGRARTSPLLRSWRDVPLNRLPAGRYLLMSRLSVFQSGPQNLVWSTQTRINGANVGPAFGGTAVRVMAASTYLFIPISTVILPIVDVDPATSTGVLRVTLSTSTGPILDDRLDEAWLFNLDIGRLVGPISCGTGSPASGGSANRLFIEPPTVDRPRPVIRIGFAADKSDSFYPAGSANQGWQFPEFKPDKVNALTVTTNALDASVTLSQFNTWHTSAAS
jgi:hypothetical protein